MRKLLFLICGFISLALGIIGAFLPVLPTTPFILISAYCFGKSSDKFYNYMLNHKSFGPLIYDYRVKKALKLKTKIYALSLMWLCLLSSILFFIPFLFAQIIVALIGVGVTIYLITFPTIKENI